MNTARKYYHSGQKSTMPRTRKTTAHLSDDDRLVIVAEMCILNQLAEDYALRLINMESIKAGFRTQSKNIKWRFNEVKVKMNHVMVSDEQKEHFHESVTSILDDEENLLKRTEKLIKGELVSVVKYQHIEEVYLISFIKGSVEIIQQIQRRLYGKVNTSYEQIITSLDEIDNGMKGTTLNKGKLNMAGIDNAFNQMFGAILKRSKKFVEDSKRERLESCSREMKQA